MVYLKGAWQFFMLLPQLMSIYNSVKKMVGDANTASFLNDLDQVTSMVTRSQDMSLPVDLRRKLRQDALEKNRGIWGRIS